MIDSYAETERLVESGCANALRIPPGCPKSADDVRSVVARGTRDGTGMAKSSQPGQEAQSAEASDRPACDMEGSRGSDEALAGSASESALGAGFMEVLGGDAVSAAESLCLESLQLNHLRPSELTRLLNSTPLGPVICDRQLYRHRMRAGFLVGQQRRIDFFRYLAWLITERERLRAGHRRVQRPGDCGLNVTEILNLADEQKRRCALTGRKLTPQTAALDHILPISRGGQHTIENAQLLDREVNKAKGTLTNDEFIAMCGQVTKHANKRTRSGNED